MSNYESIRGTRVKYLTSDPTLNSSTEGQVWYNSTEGVNKALVQIKAWSAGGSLGTAARILAGCGTQTAGLAFGGFPASVNEEYNGYNWTVGGALNTGRYGLAGAGTQTAALAFGGSPGGVTTTEEYDGSSWTAGGAMGSGRYNLGGAGIQTAGLAFGGRTTTPSALTEEYNGSAWTAGGALNTGRHNLAGVGIQTAGLAFGGTTTNPSVTLTSEAEEYDGSAWTSGNNMNTARYQLAGAGIQTSALGFGGATPTITGATEEYDSTNWTTSSASLGTVRSQLAGAGTLSQGLAFGGNAPPQTAATEEYVSSINVTPAAVWASGGNMNTTRRSMAAAGITSSGLAIGGFLPPYSAAVEEYNGTSWSNGNNTPVAKENARAGAGIQTAAFNAGGSGTDNGPAYSNSTQEYDGTNWAAGGNMNQQGLSRTSCGTLTAGLGFGGYIGGGFTTSTEEYDGSTWTTSGALPTASYYASAGTQTAALGVRSNSSPLTLNYNGTSWTAGTGNLNVLTDIGSAAKNGTETRTVFFGGNAGPVKTGATEEYDGTAFTNTASLSTARGGMAGSGDIDEAFAGGGFTGANTNVTEEYDYQGASVTTASTLTTS